MPYPLPDEGLPYTADLRWFLVAVPDDPAFVRAALGAYTEFTHYWRWGKEGKEEGREEAAQVWEDAIAATLEALEMGFPDILLGYIDGVEALLQLLIDKDCCSATGFEEIVPNYQDIVGDTIETSGSDVVVGSGTPPAGASDWTEYASKLCDAAELYADGLVAHVDNFEAVQNILQGLTAAAVVAVMASLLPLLGMTIVAAGVVITAIGVLVKLDEIKDLTEPSSGWDDMRTTITNLHDDIVCAIITADTSAEASANLDALMEAEAPEFWTWETALSFPGSVMQRIFNMESSAAGGYGSPCIDCSGSYFIADWEDTAPFDSPADWTAKSGISYDGQIIQGIQGAWFLAGGSYMRLTGAKLADNTGLNSAQNITLDRMKVTYHSIDRSDGSAVNALPYDFFLRIFAAGGGDPVYEEQLAEEGGGPNTWDISPGFTLGPNSYMQLVAAGGGSTDTDELCMVKFEVWVTQ